MSKSLWRRNDQMPTVQPGFDSWGKQAFFFHHIMYIGPACCLVGTGIFCLGIRWLGCDMDQVLQYSIESKNVSVCFMACLMKQV